MKRLFFFMSTMVLFTLLLPGMAFALSDLSAKSAVLIDAGSGRILFQKNAHERLPQASTTKITTALVALEHAQLSKKIRVPDSFVNPGESGIYLEAGETHTLEDLMYALLLKSANDAAEAIAIGIAGSIDQFVAMMNERVATLGLQDTHYVNPHGLHNENHYSSAYDLAMIAREALKYEEFRKIIVTGRYTLPWPGHDYLREVYNGNKLLKTYPWADGVKNGFTRQAGNCLVGSATKDGMQLIAVVLHSNRMYDEVAELFDAGFAQYKKEEIYRDRQPVEEIAVQGGNREQVPVVTGKAVAVALKNSEENQIQQKVYLPLSLKAPVKKGQRLGALVIRVGEDTSLTTELIAGETVPRKPLFAYLWDKFVSTFDSFLALMKL